MKIFELSNDPMENIFRAMFGNKKQKKGPKTIDLVQSKEHPDLFVPKGSDNPVERQQVCGKSE